MVVRVLARPPAHLVELVAVDEKERAHVARVLAQRALQRTAQVHAPALGQPREMRLARRLAQLGRAGFVQAVDAVAWAGGGLVELLVRVRVRARVRVRVRVRVLYIVFGVK